MKKLVSIMLAILMSFSTLCNATVVEAISESMPFNKPSISFETAAGSPREVVTVPIVISNNPGIIFAAFKINYSPEIILKSVNDSHLLEGFSFIEESNTILITNFVSDDVSKSNVGNGVIAEAVFEIPQDILPGEYSISIECSDEGSLNLNAEEITFECVSGMIKVDDVTLEKDTGFDDEIADGDVGLSDEAVSENLIPMSADIMPISTELTSADGRFNYTVSGINATITKYLGTESDLVVPETIDDYVVYGIGNKAFGYCEFLSSIILPQSVKRIEDEAFTNCSSLSSIDLGGATYLGYDLFIGCPLLTTLTIPKSVKEANYWYNPYGGFNHTPLNGSSITDVIFEPGIANIPDYICYEASNLKSVTIPEGEKSLEGYYIGNYAFAKTSLSEITIPESVTWIGQDAFYNTILTDVTIPDNVEIIAAGAFSSCKYLTNVHLGNNVTTIDSEVFYGCIRLETIEFNDKISTIGSNAFNGCSSISSIVLPQSVKRIEDEAFTNCSSLSSIDLGGATFLGWWLFEGCPLLTSVTVPKSVTSIGQPVTGYRSPFERSNISEVIFEEDTVNIPKYMCYGCKTLLSVFIPVTVESIGSYAFHNCELLKDIYYEGIDEFYWKQIYIENYNEPLQTATIHYNSKSPINQIPTFENFNIATYRANRLVNPSYPDYVDSRAVRDELSKETPSSIIVKALQDSGFDEGFELWNGVQTAFDSINDPTKLEGYVLKPRDMYMAIIVNAVEKDSTVDYGEVEKAKVTRSISKYMSAVDSMAKAEFQMDIISNTDNYRNLTSEQKEALYAFTMDWFKHETPIWSGAQKLMSTLSNILDLAASVGDCYTYAANCFTFINTTESMKSVLRELYSDSLQNGNSHMQSALSECIDIINSSKEEAILKIIDGEISLAGWGASKFLIKEFLWKEVMKEVYSLCPAMAVLMVAFKASTAVSNALFKTDELSSQYLQLQMVLDMERVSDITYSRLYNKFLGDRTTENAETLLSALDMQFALRAEDCVSASKMVSIVNDSMLHKIMSWFSKNNLDDTLEGIKFYLNSYNDTQIVSGIAWIEELEQDYPETPLFRTYSNSKDDIMSKIEAKQEHIAACPVDVYVYDESNNLVAYVEGNRVHCEDDNITIAIVDDTKYVKTYGDQIYRIEYAGYGAGTMDVTIHEFDESGNTVRDVNYYGVPVDSNTSYNIYANDENLKEDAYSLTNTSTGEVVDEQYDSLKDRTEDNIFTAEIWSGNMIYKGNICFSENLSKGESVEIHAFVPENYTFVKWEASNGKDIFGDSTDPNTTFIMPGEDIVVRAIMSSQSYDITPPTGVSLDKDKITVKVGEAVQLIHTITPENATEKAVVWISDSPEIATVDQEGNVTAIAAGKAIISVSTFDGNCTATCEVTVVGGTLGDVNGDCAVTLDDAILTLKFAMNVDLGDANFIERAADVSGNDGSITLDDAIAILKIAMNVSV